MTTVVTITGMNSQIVSAAHGTVQIAQASRELAQLGDALRQLVSQFRA